MAVGVGLARQAGRLLRWGRRRGRSFSEAAEREPRQSEGIFIAIEAIVTTPAALGAIDGGVVVIDDGNADIADAFVGRLAGALTGGELSATATATATATAIDACCVGFGATTAAGGEAEGEHQAGAEATQCGEGEEGEE